MMLYCKLCNEVMRAGSYSFSIFWGKNMYMRFLAAAAICLAMIGGCSTVKLYENNVSIVMAKDAKKGKGPLGVTDKFGLDGKIVAYVTFKWDDVAKEGGRHKVEAKWFAGDKLISVRES